MGSSSRIIEAYIGEFACGKSEIAINRALALLKESRRVTIADFDLVNPFYTLRPLIDKLESLGLKVIATRTEETIGLGEAGMIFTPQLKWVLRHEGDLILDVGYGPDGSRVLNLIEGIWQNPELKIICVLNIAKPITSDVKLIVEYIKGLGRVDAVINNSHLGSETDAEFVQAGARIVTEAARALNLPLLYSAAEESIAKEIGRYDCMENPVVPVKRYMADAFW
ncbi:MAG: hypothetical protein M1536_06005 [Firmicutes bacterium]|nr:hypothetical protein [Bacillota bacterium]